MIPYAHHHVNEIASMVKILDGLKNTDDNRGKIGREESQWI